MANLTNAQRATNELARRTHNRLNPTARKNTTDTEFLLKRKAELIELGGKAKATHTPAKPKAKTAKRKSTLTKAQKAANTVFAQIKAAQGVSAAFKARRQFLLGQ